MESKSKVSLVNLDIAKNIAKEYIEKDSHIDSGNLYAALKFCLNLIEIKEAETLRCAVNYPYPKEVCPKRTNFLRK